MSTTGDEELDDALGQAGGLAVRASREHDGLTLSLYGELDIASARILERRLQMAAASHARRLVLDLSGLSFLDSAGLHALMRVQDQVREQGQELALLRGPRAVQRVFELTQADRLFQFEE